MCTHYYFLRARHHHQQQNNAGRADGRRRQLSHSHHSGIIDDFRKRNHASTEMSQAREDIFQSTLASRFRGTPAR